MRILAPAAAALLLSTGCVHRSGSLGSSTAPVAGVTATFHRHIANAVDAGEGDLAIAGLRRKLALEPANLAVRLQLIRRYLELGFADLAVEHARLAVEKFPESAEVHIELARSLRALGLRRQAAETLESFFREHPKASAEVPAWLGIIRDELGQWPQGEAAHRAALALEPNKASLLNNLGYNLLRQGRLEEARQVLERALSLNPDSRAARNNLGTVLAAQREAALEQFRRTGDPATAHNNLACALIEQGRYAEARKELEIALGYNRNHPAALANLKLVAELDGQPPSVSVRKGQPKGISRVLRAAWRSFAGVEKTESRGPSP